MIMNATKYLRYIVTPLIALLLLCGCREEQEETQIPEFTLRVDESVSIKLPQSNTYTLTTDNPIIDYVQSGSRLDVTAIKEGKTTLTVMLDSGESRSYTFTVTANASQIGFTIISTPRVESWVGLSLKTEQTAGLQVSCEPGVDITGASADSSTRTYTFIYTETGKLLRFSAQGDFTQKGSLNNGVIATRENRNEPIQYETCTAVTIEKVNSEGKIWFTLQFADRSDIRIVTEVF